MVKRKKDPKLLVLFPYASIPSYILIYKWSLMIMVFVTLFCCMLIIITLAFKL